MSVSSLSPEVSNSGGFGDAGWLKTSEVADEDSTRSIALPVHINLGTRNAPLLRAALSNEARIWAVRQLARRAGVTREFFDSWDIDIQPAATVIHVQRGTEKKICFKHL